MRFKKRKMIDTLTLMIKTNLKKNVNTTVGFLSYNKNRNKLKFMNNFGISIKHTSGCELKKNTSQA